MQQQGNPMQEPQVDFQKMSQRLDDAWRAGPVIKAQQHASLTSLDTLYSAACELRADAERRLASANTSGYEAGRAAGYADGLAQVLAGMAAEQSYVERMAPRLQAIVEATVRHVLCAPTAEPGITGRVMHALQRAKYPVNARLSVHPVRIDELNAWKETIRTQLDSDHPAQRAIRQLEFNPDAALGMLDLRLDFDSGLIEASLNVQVDSLADWLNAAVRALPGPDSAMAGRARPANALAAPSFTAHPEEGDE
jgi:flagellar biosynthesis/type III secretory pathway protein FliH